MISGGFFSKGKTLETIALQNYTDQIKNMNLVEAESYLLEQNLSKAQTDRILKMSIGTKAKTKELIVNGKLTEEKLNEAVATGVLSQEEADLITKRHLSNTSMLDQLKSVGGLIAGFGVLVGVLALAKVYNDKYNSSVEKNRKNLSELENEHSKLQSDLDEINQKISENSARIEEINALEKPTYVDEQDLENLREQNALLESNAKLKEQELEQNKKDLVKGYIQEYQDTMATNDAQFEKDSKNWKNPIKMILSGVAYNEELTRNEELYRLEDRYEAYNDLLNKINNGEGFNLKDYGEIFTSNFAMQLGKIKPNDINALKELVESELNSLSNDAKKLNNEYNKILNKIIELDPDAIETDAEVRDIWYKYINSLKISNFDAYKDYMITYAQSRSGHSDDAEAISEQIALGYIKSYEDLINNIESQDLIEDIARWLYGNTGDEALKKAASYYWESIKDIDTKVATASMIELRDQRDEEFQKIYDWGLDEYADQIKSGTMKADYGNINMDKRYTIEYDMPFIEANEEAMRSYSGDGFDDYFEEVENDIINGYSRIDTVFGSLTEIGLNDNTVEIAFSPILQIDDGAEFISQENIDKYIETLFNEARSTILESDFDTTEAWEEALFNKVLELDANKQGIKIGEQYIHGVLAGMTDTVTNVTSDVDGITANEISRLMHFSGKNGAVVPLLDELRGWIGSSTLDEDTTKEIDELINNLNTLSESVTSFKNNTMTSADKIALLKDFPELANASDDLGKAITDLAEDKFDVLYNKLRNSGASDGLLEDLQNTYDAIMDINKALTELAGNEYIAGMNITQNSQSSWDILDGIYADLIDKEDFDWSSILNNEDFDNAFKKFGKDYTDFVEIVTKNSDNVEACQEAFNKLATAYIWSDQQLRGVTEDTKEATIAYLEQMGVENAAALVKEVLSYNELYLAKCKEKGIDATHDLNDATTEEIYNLFKEQDVLDETDKKIISYYMGKYDANSLTISTAGDCQNLIELMTMLGKTCENLKKFAKLKAHLAAIEDEYAKGNINASLYEAAVATTNKLLNGEDIVDDFTGQTSNIRDIINGTQEEIAQLYSTVDYGNVNYAGGKNSQSAKDKSGSDSEKDTKETFDWVEKKIASVERVIDKLNNTIDNTYTNWSKRNKAIADEIGMLQQEYGLEQQAYNTYMGYANSLGLDQEYVNLIQNGQMKIETITDEDKKELINEYQTWYDKANEALVKQREIDNQINQMIEKRLENIKSIYEYTISTIEHSRNMIQNKLDVLDAQGLFANGKYYQQLIAEYRSEYGQLQKERAELVGQMNQLSWDKDSEAYHNVLKSISEIDEKMVGLNVNIIETNNSLRNLGWEVFEYLEESLTNITSEAEYLVDLLSKEDLFNKDNGNFTKYADATISLRAVNYDIYKQQAKDYEEELTSLQSQLHAGAGKEVLEQYNKMVQAHRDAVKSANEEKEAILQLIEDGYNAQLEAIQKVIDKKKEQMNQEKSLYDYQKSIAEKTKNIASLEKQKMAYEGDDSEEGISKIQKIKVELEEAKADLKETEYEKYLSDTEVMLDQLTTDYQEWMNSRLDNEDALLSDILGSVQTSSSEIRNTLQEVATNNGTFISSEMYKIFDTKSPFSTMLTNGITNISNIITQGVGSLTQINTYLSKIASIVGAGSVTTNAGSNKPSSNSSSSGTSNKTNTNTNTNRNNNNNTNSNNNKSSSNNSTSSKWGSWFVHKKDSYNKSSLNINTSIVDRLKYFDIDSSKDQRAKYYAAMGGTGTYTGSDSQNRWMLSQMKSHGYKTGTKSVPKTANYWTQEDGQEIIIRKSDGAILTPLSSGDMVFDNEASRRLWELSQNPEKYLSNMSMPQLNVGTPNYSSLAAKGNISQTMEIKIDGINIELPGVTDYASFRSELIKDSTFEKAMCTMVNNIVMNKNPLEKMKYSRR